MDRSNPLTSVSVSAIHAMESTSSDRMQTFLPDRRGMFLSRHSLYDLSILETVDAALSRLSVMSPSSVSHPIVAWYPFGRGDPMNLTPLDSSISFNSMLWWLRSPRTATDALPSSLMSSESQLSRNPGVGLIPMDSRS